MRVNPLLAALVAAGLAVGVAKAQAQAPAGPAPTAAPSPPVTLISSPAGAPAASEPAPPAAAEGKPAAAVPSASASAASAVVAPAAAPRSRPAGPSLSVRIDLTAQRMSLRYGGRDQESWPISSGREGYPTPRGVFRPQWASKMWYSKKYDNAPMPHAVFFTGGVAVHGTQSVGLLGQPASHGCVRLAPANAARFYTLVHQHGFAATRIEVLGTPPAPRIAKSRPPVPVRHAALMGQPRAAVRAAPPQGYGWVAPQPRQPAVIRSANGIVYLPPGSPHRGQASFVMNGVTYVRVR